MAVFLWGEFFIVADLLFVPAGRQCQKKATVIHSGKTIMKKTLGCLLLRGNLL